MVTRELSKRILKLIGQFPAVAILGPRQVGKTTLSKSLMPLVKKNTLYLDLELPVDINRLSNPQVFFENNSEKCIIIDEVQRMPELFPVLRAVIDQHRVPGRFILLGSASPELLKHSSETLAGRIIYTELSPFLINELGGSEIINKLWIRGGFPEPYLIKQNISAEEWFQSFVRSYIERDLPNLGLRSNPAIMYRLLNMLTHNHAMILNLANLSKSLGVSQPVVAKYVDFLEMAFIVRKLRPWYINVKKRLVKTSKLYIRDSGILHHLLGITNLNQLMGHPVLGNSWEGFVIEQIINSSRPGYIFSFYRTAQGAECDLIISKGLEIRACIEMKFTERPVTTKSFTISLQDLKCNNNFIIVPACPAPYNLKDKVIVCDPFQFLGQYLTQILN
jgi:uncharacterized protein